MILSFSCIYRLTRHIHILIRAQEQSEVASGSVLVNEAEEVIEVTVEKLDEIYRTFFALRNVQDF